jgi:hypothetical protein
MEEVKNSTGENDKGRDRDTDSQHLPHRDFKALIGCGHFS